MFELTPDKSKAVTESNNSPKEKAIPPSDKPIQTESEYDFLHGLWVDHIGMANNLNLKVAENKFLPKRA